MPCAKVWLLHDGIVEGGVGAAAVEEGVDAGGVVVIPDDLARIVDAEGKVPRWPRDRRGWCRCRR